MHKWKLVLPLLLWGCSGLVYGSGKVYVWNAGESALTVTLEGRSTKEVHLQPHSGALVESVTAGDYIARAGSVQKTFSVASKKLTLLSLGAQACLARADISGMYKGGDRVRLLEVYNADAPVVLDDIIQVYPNERPPERKPRSAFAFQRLYVVPCDLLQDRGELLTYLRKQR